MSILELVDENDPILKMDARFGTSRESLEEYSKLVEDMFDTMYHHKGAGLAAPQVGVFDRIFIMDVGYSEKKRFPKVFIDPKIICQSSLEGNGEEESCLSLPGKRITVRRYSDITVNYIMFPFQIKPEYDFPTFSTHWSDLFRESWSFSGLEARCIQHEIDHLNGILITDHEATQKALKGMSSEEIDSVRRCINKSINYT